VLPAAVLVLLVLSLTVGALFFRTLNRHTQVALRLQEQVLINAATPAIERAKAKLEYLFLEQDGLPNLPRDADLTRVLADHAGDYTFSGEIRLDLDPNSDERGNGWTFELDYDNDGQSDATVAYAIFHKAKDSNIDITNRNRDKAPKLVVRNGPINLRSRTCTNLSGVAYADWESVTSGILRKTFQVTAVVLRGADSDSPVQMVTLEMQQDRQANQGNIWAAWFLDDLQFTSGPEFNWNGAMHTQGSLFLTGDATNKTRLFLVSSPSSCIFSRHASKITLQETDDFQGQVVNGALSEDAFFSGPVDVHYQNENGVVVHSNDGGNTVTLFDSDSDATGLKDSVFCEARSPEPSFCVAPSVSHPRPQYPEGTRAIRGLNFYPSDLAIDPVRSLTQGITRSRVVGSIYPSVRTVVDGQVTNQGMRDLNNLNSNKVFRDDRENAWHDNHPLVKSGRIANAQARTPFLDDTYRADNRWGPKVRYTDNLGIYVHRNDDGQLDEDDACTSGTNCNGDPITSQPSLTSDGNNSSQPSDDEEFGLDGYWERRARRHGVRIIVGQRLELGNPFGWINETAQGGDSSATGPLSGNGRVDMDFMNAPDPLACDRANDTSVEKGRCHERRQGRTFRDNLAAVQSTAIYHYLHQDGKFPVACLATTTHPGTWYTIQQARTFNTVPVGSSEKELDIDFLYGRGTNGWEFNPPGDVDSDTSFKGLMDNSDSPLRRALKNLAYLSGDPHGAFPPTQDTWITANNNDNAVPDVGPVVHPHPTLTMWGDYSNLRRVIKLLDGATNYDSLSIADRSTLHTASCTLGMLAYSLETKIAAAEAVIGIGVGSEDDQIDGSIVDKFLELFDDATGEEIIGDTLTNRCMVQQTGCPMVDPYAVDADHDDHYTKYFAQFTPEQWINAVRTDSSCDAACDTELDKLEEKISVVETLSQIQRDRTYGFKPDPYTLDYTIPNDSSDSEHIQLPWKGRTYRMTCDPSAASSRASTGSNPKIRLALAMVLCNPVETPKFPALYYLFPRVSHDHGGAGDHTQPSSEPYIGDDYVSSNSVNGGFMYQANSLGDISLTPKGNSDDDHDWNDYDADWKLPQDSPPDDFEDQFNDARDPSTGTITGVDNSEGTLSQLLNEGCELNITNLNNRTCESGLFNIIQGPDGKAHRLGFMDKAFFNGREQMVVRALDIDLDLLRRKMRGADHWLPLPSFTAGDDTQTGAIFYAFREDAVREDAIARPRKAEWNDDAWRQYVNQQYSGTAEHYLMDAYSRDPNDNNEAQPKDPPLYEHSRISPKPVDFFPDPDRRPYGFRLRNGSDLRRINESDDLRGFSFITDNAVYIQGDFNLHQDSGGNPIQEFVPSEHLSSTPEDPNNSWANFYDRSTLDTRFADTDDQWRVAEIVADAVHILSKEFKDGWISVALTADLDASYGINDNIDISNCNDNDCIDNDRRPQPRHSNYYAFYHATNNNPRRNNLDPLGNDVRSWLRPGGEPSLKLPWIRYNYEDQDVEAAWDARLKWPILVDRNGFPLWCNHNTLQQPPDGCPSRKVLPWKILTGTGSIPQDSQNQNIFLDASRARVGHLADPDEGGNQRRFKRERIGAATPTTVNALIVQGLVAVRGRASVSLENYLRLLEKWRGQAEADWRNRITLNFSGSFQQLNYSTSSTAHIGWLNVEPGEKPIRNRHERNSFYMAPKRNWGYDPALQYAPPGAVAIRFVTPSRTRSEFYRELPADDDYIMLLRCAEYMKDGAVTKVDTSASCPSPES